MRDYVLTVTPNPTLDQIVLMDDFQTGRDARVQDKQAYPGGKGVNVARVLNNFNVPVLASGFLGGTHQALIKQQLDEEGIAYDFSPIKDHTRLNLTVLDRKQDKITRVLEKGPKVTSKEKQLFLQQYDRRVARAAWVVCAGSLPQGIDDAFYAQLIRRANHVPVVVDTAGASLLRACKAKPFLIKPNQQEAEAALMCRLRGRPSWRGALEHFLALGAQHVIISLGEKGAVGTDGCSCYYVCSPKAKGNHYVGCGDALVAGFVYASRAGWDFAEALAMGVASGSANLSVMPSGNIKLNTVKSLLKKITVEKF